MTDYTFYLDEIKLPVTPESLSIKINNRNETVVLINDGEINLLKTPGLSDVSFEFLIPKRKRGFTQDLEDVSSYLDYIENLKVNSKVFQFIVYRESVAGDVLFKTDMTVTLEDYEIAEEADNNSDVTISVNLKQYRAYGTKIIEVKQDGTATKKPTASTNKKNTTSKSKTYVVKSGDTLWAIAKKQLGDATKWTKIYSKNKSTIESTAKKHGYKSSSNGHWIFPRTKLIIP